jgi:hypothetical protein
LNPLQPDVATAFLPGGSFERIDGNPNPPLAKRKPYNYGDEIAAGITRRVPTGVAKR